MVKKTAKKATSLTKHKAARKGNTKKGPTTSPKARKALKKGPTTMTGHKRKG